MNHNISHKGGRLSMPAARHLRPYASACTALTQFITLPRGSVGCGCCIVHKMTAYRMWETTILFFASGNKIIPVRHGRSMQSWVNAFRAIFDHYFFYCQNELLVFTIFFYNFKLILWESSISVYTLQGRIHQRHNSLNLPLLGFSETDILQNPLILEMQGMQVEPYPDEFNWCSPEHDGVSKS